MFWNQCKTVVIGLAIVVFTAGGATVLARQFGAPFQGQQAGGGTGIGPDPARAESKILMASSGSQIIVWNGDQTRFSGYSVESGSWKTKALGSGVKGTPVMGAGITIFQLTGDEIREAVAFGGQPGEFRTFTLQEPVKGKLTPIVGAGVGCCQAGRFLYAFSAKTGRWDTLELEQEHATVSPIVSAGYIMVEHGTRLDIFSGVTGTWSGIDVGE
jgi:hypothetical protein